MKKMLFLMIIGALIFPECVEASITLTVTGEVTPSQLVPGSEGYIRLSINNIGSDDISTLYVQLVSLDSPLAIGDYADLKKSYIGGIKAGGSKEKIYKFQVPSGTPSGTYAARYSVSQLSAGEDKLMVSGYVLIPVQAPSSLIIKSLTPNSFRPGERARIEITLANIGEATLNDLEISWEISEDKILPLGSDNKIAIPSIGPMEEMSLPMDVVISPNIVQGIYSFLFTTSYYDQDGSKKTTNSTIGIIVERLPETDISIGLTPSSFSPGEKVELIFSISNIGDSDLNDLSISWEVKDGVILPLGLSNTIFTKSLNAGDHIQIPVAAIVDKNALAAIYPLSVEATYSDAKGIQRTDNFTVGILIGGTTDFKLSFQGVSGKTTSLSIGNIGVNSAKAISVSIPPQKNFLVIGPSEVFVGNLDPGDFSVASFQLAPKQEGGVLAVQIYYTDASGNRQVLDKEITVGDLERSISSESTGMAPHGGSNNGSLYVTIGIGGLMGTALLYLVFRRSKKKK